MSIRPGRPPRQILHVRSDAGNDVARQDSSRLRKRVDSGKRIDGLIRKNKSLQRELAYARAVASAVLAAPDPTSARAAAFVAGLEALAATDTALASSLGELSLKLSSEAAALVLADLERGPHILVELARDPALAARIAGGSPTDQAVELGKLLARIESSQPVQPTVVAPLSIFSLFAR